MARSFDSDGDTEDLSKHRINTVAEDHERPGFRRIADGWGGRIVLSLDGNMLTSLLTLEQLIEEISKLEQETPSASSSSFSPIFRPAMLDFDEVNFVGKAVVPDERHYRLCHYFDYITGTGVAGLLAVLLSTMRLSVGETLQRISKIWREMTPCSPKQVLPKYTRAENSEKFRDHLQDVLGDLYNELQEQSIASMNVNSSYQPCQTIILATQNASKGVTRPYVFRSYQKDFLGYLLREASLHPQIVTWDAVCAASAAPSFYSKVEVKGLTGKFKYDNGPWTDATNDVYREVRALHDVQALLSIVSKPKREVPWKLGSRACNRHSMSREETDTALRRLARQEGFQYERIESYVASDSDDMSDETVERLRCDIEAFCKVSQQKTKIRAWAKFLVTTRRLRARTIHWESFAELRMKCRLCSSDRTCFDRHALARHFRDAHAIDPLLLQAFEHNYHADMTTQ